MLKLLHRKDACGKHVRKVMSRVEVESILRDYCITEEVGQEFTETVIFDANGDHISDCCDVEDGADVQEPWWRLLFCF